jgi:hypothetical protein
MSNIGKIIRVNALPPLNERENNVIYQVAAPGAATYTDYAIDSNGDLKTPSYIPLTGTEEGKPLTKNIEVDHNEEGSVGFISNTPDVSEAVIAIQEGDSVLAESRNKTDNSSSSISVHHDTGIEISATTPNDQFSAIVDVSGLQGNEYIQPTSDQHYAQRKYIADNFTSQTAFNSTLANYYTKPETYSKTEVDAKFSAVYRPKGSVNNFTSLPTTGNVEGDVWNLLDTGANYVWVIDLNNTGVAGWDKLSETVDLTNYVTLNTDQNIEGRKQFIRNGGGENWDNNPITLLGLGGKFAGLTFYSSGLDVGQLTFNGNFNFMNDTATGYKNLVAQGYYKAGSTNSYMLLGAGDHRPVSDFALASDLGNYWSKHIVSGYTGVNANTPFSILNGNTYQQLLSGGLLASDDYSDVSLIPALGIYAKGNIATQYYGSAIDWAIAATWVNTYGNKVHKIDTTGSINNDSDTRTNATFFDYNWADTGYTGSVVNFSGLTGGWNVELFSTYYLGTGDKIGIRSRNGDAGTWNAPRWLWHSDNFDPNNYVPITGNVNVEGTKRFTGTSTEWVLNNDETNNAIGFTQSLTDQFVLGTANNKNVVIWRNGSPKIVIEDGLTTFNTNISVPNAIANNHAVNLEQLNSIIGSLPDFRLYGLGTATEGTATDIDTIPQTSILGINDGTANRPAGVGYGSVWTHRKSATEFTQLATEIFSGQLFTRGKSDAGGFTPWRKQWDSINLPNPVSQTDLGNYVPYTGANQPVNIGSQNLSTTGIISSSAFYSPVVVGGQILAANATQIFFGNPSVAYAYHETGANHVFTINGAVMGHINSSGASFVGLKSDGIPVLTESQKGIANGIAPLSADSKISSAYLPSYVDDVLEFANLVSFPAVGESGKIYVDLDTNLTYRWGGSSYTQISAGAVQSVNGHVGIVTLGKSDVGLGNADNTSDAAKNVLSATKWTTSRTLSYTGDVTGSASVDGSGNVGFAMTLANSGVSAGTYNSVNVDAKGRVLSGSNINYATESYVTDLLQQNYFDQSVSDERFVNAEGDETINGNKTFSSSPSIPAATSGDHAVNLEQLTANLAHVVNDNDDFKLLEVYRLIDSTPIDLDDTRVKKYNIVFDGSSNGSVNINHLRDNQYYQFSNIAGTGADLRIGVEGYGMVDIVSPGKTAVYMSWGDGKLLKISENTNVSII